MKSVSKVLVVLAVAASGGQELAYATQTAVCTLRNPYYAGDCVQNVQYEDGTADDACQGVLSYLNDPLSTGKDYCDTTTIRGGWNLVKVESGS